MDGYPDKTDEVAEVGRSGDRRPALKNNVTKVSVGNVIIGGDNLAVAAGPCVLESLELGMRIAEEMKSICDELGIGYIFKASFDKANRTSIHSYRGPGIEKGLDWLEKIGRTVGVPLLTDIHEPPQARIAAEVVDILQIPAFLCRQTDLLVAAGRTGKPVNIKKAQFLAPEDMAPAVEKCLDAGCPGVVLCERGASFGYHQLVVDFRSLPVMRSLGCPVMFDATHSVQQPGGRGTSSGGDRRFVPSLIHAAIATGVDSLFMEVHPNPNEAKSDGPNMIPLSLARDVLRRAALLDKAVRESVGFADLGWADEWQENGNG